MLQRFNHFYRKSIRIPKSALHSYSTVVQSEEPPIQFQVAPSEIGVITFNRPDKMNALTEEMAHMFVQLFEREIVPQQADLRAIVLQGAGDKAFSAGGDFDFLLERTRVKPYENSRRMQQFYKSFLWPMIRDLDLPIVSAINGHAVGAGLCIAMATDIRVARADAKLGVSFTPLGLSPGMACTHFMPRLIGYQMATYLMLTGELISGTRAREIGLVMEDIADSSDAVKARAFAIAQHIASNPSHAVKLTTRSLRMSQLDMIERHLLREADSQAQCYATDEYKSKVEEKMK